MISAVQTPGEGAGTLPLNTKLYHKVNLSSRGKCDPRNPNLSAGPSRPLEGEWLTAPTICRKATSNERSR